MRYKVNGSAPNMDETVEAESGEAALAIYAAARGLELFGHEYNPAESVDDVDTWEAYFQGTHLIHSVHCSREEDLDRAIFCPMSFVQTTRERAQDLAEQIGDIDDMFYDGGSKYQEAELSKTEAAIAAAEALLLRLTELAQAQCYYAEKHGIEKEQRDLARKMAELDQAYRR